MAKADPKIWAELISYDPKTGDLRWLERPIITKHDKAWNVRFAGQIVGLFFNGYRVFKYQNNKYLAHRVAWAIQTGEYPSHGIDHINGVRDDNRWANLRDVPQAENLKNQAISIRNKSGRSGILYRERDKRWCAAIYAEKKHVYLGSYLTREEAIAARQAAEKVLGYHKNHGRDPVPFKGTASSHAV